MMYIMYIHSSNEVDKRINVSKIANNISAMVFILVVYHLCCLKISLLGYLLRVSAHSRSLWGVVPPTTSLRSTVLHGGLP